MPPIFWKIKFKGLLFLIEKPYLFEILHFEEDRLHGSKKKVTTDKERKKMVEKHIRRKEDKLIWKQ